METCVCTTEHQQHGASILECRPFKVMAQPHPCFLAPTCCATSTQMLRGAAGGVLAWRGAGPEALQDRNYPWSRTRAGRCQQLGEACSAPTPGEGRPSLHGSLCGQDDGQRDRLSPSLPCGRLSSRPSPPLPCLLRTGTATPSSLCRKQGRSKCRRHPVQLPAPPTPAAACRQRPGQAVLVARMS